MLVGMGLSAAGAAPGDGEGVTGVGVVSGGGGAAAAAGSVGAAFSPGSPECNHTSLTAEQYCNTCTEELLLQSHFTCFTACHVTHDGRVM